MAAKRKQIKTSEVAELLGVHPKTVAKGTFGFKRYPMNPAAKRPTYLFDKKEVIAFLKHREQLGR